MARYIEPLGMVSLEYDGDGISSLQITADCSGLDNKPDPFAEKIFSQISEYISGSRREFDLKLNLGAQTPFQRAVYEELLLTPYGQSRSYGQIARAIGRPGAARAVGMACNRNPIHIIIPCHRVVGSNGALVGYAAGVDLKRMLLKMEGLFDFYI
ncbi:MAG: methylated-DNA--[protein]-cysteine S-methyltransferase [Rikenellaceae bacterium]